MATRELCWPYTGCHLASVSWQQTFSGQVPLSAQVYAGEGGSERPPRLEYKGISLYTSKKYKRESFRKKCTPVRNLVQTNLNFGQVWNDSVFFIHNGQVFWWTRTNTGSDGYQLTGVNLERVRGAVSLGVGWRKELLAGLLSCWAW